MSKITTRFWFDGKPLRDDGELICLTDMWRAAGDDGKKRPSDWLAFESVREFRDYLETTLPEGSLIRTAEGRNGGTWAHWQLAMAYAKYLSPAFHAWCNDVVRKVLGGQPVGADQRVLTEVVAAISELRDGLHQLRNNVASLWGNVSQGGHIAPARYEAFHAELIHVAELEVAAGRWQDRRSKSGRLQPARKLASNDIYRELGEALAWGGKCKPWRFMPEALEPAALAILRRRKRDALKRVSAGRQLSLIKSA